MKTLRLLLLGTLLGEMLLISSAQAQVPSARRLTQKVAPPATPAQTNVPGRLPARGVTPLPAQQLRRTPPSSAPTPSSVTRVLRTQVLVRPAPAPIDPEKARVAKEETLRRTVEFQKKRAEEGSESAQYELGIRYLKGDGVVKDESTARKWLRMSAQSGYGPATKRLQEVDRPVEAPKTLDSEK